MAKKQLKAESITKEQLIDEITQSEEWIILNSTDIGVNFRAKSAKSLVLLAEMLEADREIFKMVCDYINEIDAEEKSKLN